MYALELQFFTFQFKLFANNATKFGAPGNRTPHFIFMNKLQRIFNYYFFSPNFKKFWKENRNNKNIHPELKNITDIFITSESFNLVSKFWEYLNIKNFKQIINEGGIENYANTIARNYFTYLHVDNYLISKTLDLVSDENFKIEGQIFKKHQSLDYDESFRYNALTLLLYANIKKLNLLNKLNQISDIGFCGFNDSYLVIDNVKVTTDKLISLLDYENILNSIPEKKFNIVLEIGAGSGRLSDIFMTFNKDCKYIVCDIPPAIFISYTRLKKVFKNKKIKILVDIDNTDKIEKSIIENDVLFIFPKQLSIIKNLSLDLIIAIDCIHEMDKFVIKYYFNEIDKLSKFFYFSVWDKTIVPFSAPLKSKMNRLYFEENDYPIPNNWKMIYKNNLIFPSNYISSAYKIIGVD